MVATFGAAAFGLVIGWTSYSIHRYRKNEVGLADIASLIAVLGGGGIVSLFGPGNSALFAAYAAGLAVGFFAYFATLLFLVTKSKGYSLDWFIDGRRPRLGEHEEIPTTVRPTVAPMGMQPPSASQLHELATLRWVSGIRNRLLLAVTAALSEVERRRQGTSAAELQAQYSVIAASLSQLQQELITFSFEAPLRPATPKACVSVEQDMDVLENELPLVSHDDHAILAAGVLAKRGTDVQNALSELFDSSH